MMNNIYIAVQLYLDDVFFTLYMPFFKEFLNQLGKKDNKLVDDPGYCRTISNNRRNSRVVRRTV